MLWQTYSFSIYRVRWSFIVPDNIYCRRNKTLLLTWWGGANLHPQDQSDRSLKSASAGPIWKNQGKSLRSSEGNHLEEASKGQNQTLVWWLWDIIMFLEFFFNNVGIHCISIDRLDNLVHISHKSAFTLHTNIYVINIIQMFIDTTQL